MKNNIKEIIKFLINGGVCFIIEYILMVLFTDKLNIYYLLSSTIAFILATVVNYIICVCWVFNINKDVNKKQQIMFFATSLIALGLNQLLMFLGVTYMKIGYKIMKIISTGIVTVFNYFLKKGVLNKSIEKTIV